MPLACASCALLGAATLQVAASALAAAYVGFLYGCVLGGTQSLAWLALGSLRSVRFGFAALGGVARLTPRLPGAALRLIHPDAWACVVRL